MGLDYNLELWLKKQINDVLKIYFSWETEYYGMIYDAIVLRDIEDIKAGQRIDFIKYVFDDEASMKLILYVKNIGKTAEYFLEKGYPQVNAHIQINLKKEFLQFSSLQLEKIP